MEIPSGSGGEYNSFYGGKEGGVMATLNNGVLNLVLKRVPRLREDPRCSRMRSIISVRIISPLSRASGFLLCRAILILLMTWSFKV
jgi:hypothetical protein